MRMTGSHDIDNIETPASIIDCASGKIRASGYSCLASAREASDGAVIDTNRASGCMAIDWAWNFPHAPKPAKAKRTGSGIASTFLQRTCPIRTAADSHHGGVPTRSIETFKPSHIALDARRYRRGAVVSVSLDWRPVYLVLRSNDTWGARQDVLGEKSHSSRCG